MEKNKLALVDNLQEYVIGKSLRETDLLSLLREETAKDPAAIMQIPPEQGQFMALLVKLIGAKRSIEVGVYTGYSALCVAQAMPDESYTVACDIDEEWTGVAKKYWRQAGVEHKIDLRIAPAAETLQLLLDEGQAGTFDFVFIDADKESYDIYYELSLRLLRPGGLMAIDNVLLFGLVVENHGLDASSNTSFSEACIKAVRALNIKIKSDERVDISMLPIADGITLAMKR